MSGRMGKSLRNDLDGPSPPWDARNGRRIGIRIETNQDLERAIARLTRRAPESLATFIVSLAHDFGPIGEHVCTFISADDRAETIASLEERIASLAESQRSDWRHQAGRNVGERLGYILDSIETAVLPADPQEAFRLLVLALENDGPAMESCGDHHDSVGSAFDRASEVTGKSYRMLLHEKREDPSTWS